VKASVRHRVRTAIAASVALSSIAFVIAAAASVRADHRIAGVALLVAILWGTVPFVIDVFLGGAISSKPSRRGSRSVTTVVHLGAEPAEVARATIDVAALGGPTVIITTGRPDLADIIDLADVPVYVAASIDEALRRAAADIETDGVLIVSASAIPVWAACEAAAGELSGEVAWVAGRSGRLWSVGYAPDGRDSVGAGLRARARAGGAVVWERDATLVAARFLRDHPPAPGRPWGDWIRRLERLGFSGTDVPHTMSVRAVPADARSFWPASVARQRAAVADLAAALRFGPIRARALVFGLLLRELYAWPFVLWLVAPVIVAGAGGFPFARDPVLFLVSCAALAVARWLVQRSMHDLEPAPLNDALDLAYGAPGSMLALCAVGSGRVRLATSRLPERPLTWAALALTVVVAVPLIDRGTGVTASRSVASALAIVDLLVLWMFALRAMVQRAWARTAGRVPVDLEVWVDGRRASTCDGSQSGLSVTGAPEGLSVGDRVAVQVRLDDGTGIEAPAVVAHRRRGRAGQVTIGLSMPLSRADRVQWVRQLYLPEVRAAAEPGTHGVRRPKPVAVQDHRGPKAVALLLLDRAAILLMGVVSAIAVGSLMLVLVGYRPVVVRSGSMVPTIAIGDVVILEQVRAGDVQPGEIVTLDDPYGGGESITHRTRSVSSVDGRLVLETRGDANAVSEYRSMPADALIGREVQIVPKIGAVVSDVNSAVTRSSLIALAAALVVVPAVAGLFRRRRIVRRSPRLGPSGVVQ
jgi:signal peptidase I